MTLTLTMAVTLIWVVLTLILMGMEFAFDYVPSCIASCLECYNYINNLINLLYINLIDIDIYSDVGGVRLGVVVCSCGRGALCSSC